MKNRQSLKCWQHQWNYRDSFIMQIANSSHFMLKPWGALEMMNYLESTINEKFLESWRSSFKYFNPYEEIFNLDARS